MAWDSHVNFSKGTLTNSPGTAGTSFVLGTGEGALFAANTPVTIVPANTQPTSTNSEIGYVTAVATDTLTITRTQQGSTNQNVAAGWVVLGTVTAKALTDIESAVDTHIAGTSVHGASGAVVGTTNAQTLTNKTLTAPVIGDFTNATHSHTNAASGGQIALSTGTTGTLTVSRGGTGTTTLTGLVVGNGTGSMSAVTAPSGTVVGTTDTQTLSNKTLTAPKLASAGFIADANGNEVLRVPATVASAVNDITINNATTLNNPYLQASGDDTNIDLVLQGKGTGGVIAGNTGLMVYGNSTTPATPATNAGKIWMSGTSATRPRFINSSGTVENLLTNLAGATVTSFTNTGTGAGTFYYTQIGGVKVLWGQSGTQSVGGSLGTATYNVNLPASFFTSVQSVIPGAGPNGQQYVLVSSFSTTTVSVIVQNQQGTSVTGEYITLLVIGS